ncbi:MAG: transposase [Candidatus Sungbacteria bacterium]|uniref:Transposase n=1 Tax=Candidatus Sungiibacteriota bacterium TaxID=2750080 RepID=A0A9D6HQN0_9BACT|nr:transposase [Candidatus Sungbacteria bacterium]
MQRLKFENGQYYHIYNRGAGKGNIFYEYKNYRRFLSGIYHFNNINFKPDNFDFDYQGLTLVSPSREELVDVICWCLMPNHYHLILRQKLDNGITKFMRRLGTGYTMYLNKKYEHSGHVFQGAFKAKHIEKDRYLQHLVRYIHLNPLELLEPDWKENGIKNKARGKKFVIEYKWNSLNDYLGKNNFPEILSPLAKKIVQEPSDHLNFLWEWLDIGVPESLPRSDLGK